MALLISSKCVPVAVIVTVSDTMCLLISFKESNPPQNRQPNVLMSRGQLLVDNVCGGVDLLEPFS